MRSEHSADLADAPRVEHVDPFFAGPQSAAEVDLRTMLAAVVGMGLEQGEVHLSGSRPLDDIVQVERIDAPSVT